MAEEEQQNNFGNEEETFSLEDLDQILEQEDPGFAESLQQIKEEGVGDAEAIEALAVNSDEEGDAEGPGQTKTQQIKNRIEKIRARIVEPCLRAQDFLQMRWRVFRNQLALFHAATLDFLRQGLPERIRWAKSQVRVAYAQSRETVKVFWAKPLAERLGYLGIGFCGLGALIFMAMIFKSTWLPEWEDPILTSYLEVGKDLGDFSNSEDFQPLFEAFPEVEFPVRLKKVVVNLRRSPGGGRLPMGIFEFFLGVDARDTAVEIRDREKELVDLVQRTLEEFTYNEVMSYPGKVLMKSKIKENINEVLNQGQVNQVYINRMITNQ